MGSVEIGGAGLEDQDEGARAEQAGWGGRGGGGTGVLRVEEPGQGAGAQDGSEEDSHGPKKTLLWPQN
jgi:hypothetical protein